MTPEEKAIRQKLKDNFEHYALKCLKIRTKEVSSKSGAIEPFSFNRAQKYVHQRLEEQKRLTGKVRALILKGRQQGISTYVGGRYYHNVTHHFGTQAFILTHALDATQNLYKMAQRYYENTPEVVKPQVTTSNSKELIFGLLDSGYKLGTAENKAVGRSATIQLLHGSEVAFWNNASEHAKGILQAVPNSSGTEIILESTANGLGNFFHQQWQLAEAGLSDYIAVFVPWFWQDEYTIYIDEIDLTPEEMELKEFYGLNNGQIAWRRQKIRELSVNGTDGEKSFKQEYPCNSEEAFQLTGEDSYIDSTLVMRARKTQKVEIFGKKYLGVDIARFGDDRTSFIMRQGRRAYALESYIKKDVMEVTGLVVQAIQKHQPDKVMIDMGAMGSGVYDRLKELGYKEILVAVNFGGKPLDAKKYVAKREEMWGLCKEWLADEPCQIPDSDTLHADLCGVRYSIDSNSRLKMESKTAMKKRGIRSSDEADALCLTFAHPEINSQNASKNNDLAVNIMKNQFRRIQDESNYYGV